MYKRQDFDDNIFAAGEDDILPPELIDYLKENKFDLIENILQGQTDNVHFILDFFIPLIIFLVKQVYEKRHPGQTIFLEETPNPLPNISRFWGYGLFTWG